MLDKWSLFLQKKDAGTVCVCVTYVIYNDIGIYTYISQDSEVVKEVQCIMQADAHAISLFMHIDYSFFFFFFCSCLRMCKQCWCQFPYWLQLSLCYSLGRGQCDTFLIPLLSVFIQSRWRNSPMRFGPTEIAPRRLIFDFNRVLIFQFHDKKNTKFLLFGRL